MSRIDGYRGGGEGWVEGVYNPMRSCLNCLVFQENFCMIVDTLCIIIQSSIPFLRCRLPLFEDEGWGSLQFTTNQTNSSAIALCLSLFCIRG